jgi:DNA repair exonuclease SbcCD ATPase subunit
MRYRKFCQLSLLSFLLLAMCAGSAWAQQSQKPKRPVKTPPQYPNIIDLEDKSTKPAQATEPKSEELKPPKLEDKQAAAVTVDPVALTKAFTIIAEELKSLSQEVKALNVRQDLEVELARQARIEQRIDRYESELRPIRERLSGLEAEENRLPQLMTRDALLLQTANTATINREATMEQIRSQYGARLQAVRDEKERLLRMQAAQTESLGIYHRLSDEIEQKIQKAEEKLRQLEAGKSDRNP